ncbi:MAG: RnfABCDGE type electron transport complex subunit D [Clostridiaceae bacterium]|nr:RnfABCDGE type electron transport complex subunit D [Clostridiaceae bacterium]
MTDPITAPKTPTGKWIYGVFIGMITVAIPYYGIFVGGTGLGYSGVLLIIAFFREFLEFGTIFGISVVGDWWVNSIFMIMPPGAFFMLAIVLWVANSFVPQEEETQQKEVANHGSY